MTESSRPFWYAMKVNQSYSPPQPCRHFWTGAISTPTHTHTHTYTHMGLSLLNTVITINFTDIEIKVFLHPQLLWLLLQIIEKTKKNEPLHSQQIGLIWEISKGIFAHLRLVNENGTTDANLKYCEFVSYFHPTKNRKSTSIECMMISYVHLRVTLVQYKSSV